MRRRRLGLVVLGLVLAGCEHPPKEFEPLGEGDCSVEALGGVGELSGGLGDVFGGSGSGRGGSVTVRNADQCDAVNVWHVSPNGTTVCVGGWCPDSPPETPVTGTPEQLRALTGGGGG